MKKLTEDVARELARFGSSAQMTSIVSAWPEAVGATIARNAWPARISRDGTLHVATNSSSWAFELGQLRGDVLRRLGELVGSDAPTELRFAVGKLPELGPGEDADRATRTRREPPPEDVRRGAELAAEIEDEELRDLVAKAAAQSLVSTGANRRF